MLTSQAIAAFTMRCGKGLGPAWSGLILIQKGQPCLVPVPGATYNPTLQCHVFPGGERLRVETMRIERDYWRFHGHRFSFVSPGDLCEKLVPMVKTLQGFKPGLPSIFYTEETSV